MTSATTVARLLNRIDEPVIVELCQSSCPSRGRKKGRAGMQGWLKCDLALHDWLENWLITHLRTHKDCLLESYHHWGRYGHALHLTYDVRAGWTNPANGDYKRYVALVFISELANMSPLFENCHLFNFLEATRRRMLMRWKACCWSRKAQQGLAWRWLWEFAGATWWRTRTRRSTWSSAWHETWLNSELEPLILMFMTCLRWWWWFCSASNFY